MIRDEYRQGHRDGLREALALLAAEEAKWAEKMERYGSGRTFQQQRIRHKALQVAQTRIRTALNLREKQDEKRGDDTTARLRTALNRLAL